MAALLAIPTLATAQDGEPETNGFTLFAAGFFPSADSSFQTFDPENGLAPPIDFETDLEVDDSATALRLGLIYRFGRTSRHQIELSYLEIDRSGSLLLNGDIEFGGEIFRVDANVATDVVTRDIDLNYTYFFVNNEQGDFGILVGLHAVRAEAALTGAVRVGQGGPNVPVRQESVSEEVPLPLVGLRGNVRFSPKFELGGGVKILDLEIDDVKGQFVDFWVRLAFKVHDHFHLGAGWSILDVDVDQLPKDSKILKAAQWQYSGPEVFVRVPF